MDRVHLQAMAIHRKDPHMATALRKVTVRHLAATHLRDPTRKEWSLPLGLNLI